MRVVSLPGLYTFGILFHGIFFLFQPLCWAAGHSCYRRGGIIAQSDGVCNPLAEESVCCGPSWTCLENGLCRDSADKNYSEKEILALGSCTDSTWNTIECIQPCGGEQ